MTAASPTTWQAYKRQFPIEALVAVQDHQNGRETLGWIGNDAIQQRLIVATHPRNGGRIEKAGIVLHQTGEDAIHLADGHVEITLRDLRFQGDGCERHRYERPALTRGWHKCLSTIIFIFPGATSA